MLKTLALFTFMLVSTMLVSIAVLSAVEFNPPPPLPPATPTRALCNQEKTLPELEKLNPSNWGTIRQTGKNFAVEGHPLWEAVGVIREDGSISLLWTLLATQEPCPGEYDALPNGELSGVWGYSDEGELKDGKTTGLSRPDRIYKLIPAAPEPDN